MILSKEKMDFILFIAQILSLIFLIVYVVKTWHMASATRKSAEAAEKTLREMKEMRDQETAPYVVVYFENARGTPFIYLIVKNIGKTVARDVKIDFSPPLKSSTQGANLGDMPMITEGIASLAPGQQLRTFFDSAISYFGRADLPLHIVAKISYCGGLRTDTRAWEQTLDLQALRGLLYTQERGINELVEQVEELAKSSSKSHSELRQIAQLLTKQIGVDKTSRRKYGWRPKKPTRL